MSEEHAQYIYEMIVRSAHLFAQDFFKTIPERSWKILELDNEAVRVPSYNQKVSHFIADALKDIITQNVQLKKQIKELKGE